jgi:TRAP-type C4-dicarboxylate transport system permease small subunit
MDLTATSRKLGILSSVLSYVGAAALFGMMSLTAVDVAGRYLFNHPIIGVFEVTEYLVLILIFSFLGYAQSQDIHVSVDILQPLLPERLRWVIDLINHGVCLVLMIVIFWMGIQKAIELKSAGEASPNLGIPDYPFVFFLAVGCFVMCLEYLRNIIELLAGPKKDSQP